MPPNSLVGGLCGGAITNIRLGLVAEAGRKLPKFGMFSKFSNRKRVRSFYLIHLERVAAAPEKIAGHYCLPINLQLRNLDQWDEVAIKQRAEELSKRALIIWPKS